MPKSKNPPLFISYERRDSGGWSLIIFDHLERRFGKGVAFRDKQGIEFGAPWRDDLRRKVSGCSGFLLIIGPDWSESRLLDRLREPDQWVRKEVEVAVKSGKRIFPCFVGGAKIPPLDQLPQAIRTAIDQPNHFYFEDGPNWEKNLSSLFDDIETATGLVRRKLGTANNLHRYDRVLALLDRNRQSKQLRRTFEAEGRLFLATGAKKAGFRYFALRCALKVLGVSDRESGERIEALNWSRFADPGDATERRSALLGDIANRIIDRQSLGGDSRQIAAKIARVIQQTNRPTVFYCIVPLGNRIDGELAEEWFAVWRDLMGPRPPRRVTAILFVERGFWHVIPASSLRAQGCDAAVEPALGKIPRTELDNWLVSDLANAVDDSRQLDRIKRSCASVMSWWRRSSCFDDIAGAVIDTWNSSAPR